MQETSQREKSRVIIWMAGALLLGLCLSLAAAWRQDALNRERAVQNFGAQADQISEQLIERMNLYTYGLRGARGAFVVGGTDRVNRAQFQHYSRTRDVDGEFPGARGFGFIRRVPREQEASFVESARADGWPEFAVRELGPNPGERYVIQYIEPVERNRAAVGLDIASEANRRQAAQIAMRTGTPTLTGPITLVQVQGERQRSLLLLLPVYRAGLPLQTEAQRETATMGWTYAPLALKEVLADFGVEAASYDIRLVDISAGEPGELVFDSGEGRAQEAAGRATRAPLLMRNVQDVLGRRWAIELRSRPVFFDRLEQTSPVLVFMAGLLSTLLLTALVGVARRSHGRERELADQQAQLATVIENSADAIVGQGLDGRVIIWNRAAEQLFGFSAEQAQGQPLSELLLEEGGSSEKAELLARVVRGEVCAPFDSKCRRSDGSEIDLSVTAGAIR